MAGAKYFGEERTKDAVYAIYLRKVRYVPPPGIGSPNNSFGGSGSQEASFEIISDQLQWETIRERVIRAGTLPKLVESLIGDDSMMDSTHFNVFFATYRAFTTCENVCNLLIDRYCALNSQDTSGTNCSKNATAQCSIRSLILCWLEMYPEDFNEPGTKHSSLSKLMEFARTHKIFDICARVRELRESFKRNAKNGHPTGRSPSMDEYVFVNEFDAPDYDTCVRRANLFDISKENCVQIAEQLTFWDAELFKELLPQQCQGRVWSRRHQKGLETVHSVRATINQFNSVVQKIMTSIVLPDCRADFRAKVISKWIDVARELRALKNFSSLKAVISALQSEPVYRLKSTWSHVSSASLAQFKELSAIFDTDDQGGERRIREILEEEGTAKSSPLKRPQLVQNCRRTKSDVNLAESQGTVPYLGTFLTDLAMIDQAHPDVTEDGLLNFEKRRKEFEVIAKIRLFQSAARGYKIPMDMAFCSWFCFLPSLDENQCFARSLEVDLPTNAAENARMSKMLSPHASKINTLSRIFSGISVEDGYNDSSQDLNDSAVINHDTHWLDDQIKLAPYYPFIIGASKSYTAPSTPSSTISWKGGSEFSPTTAFKHQRSTSGDAPKKPPVSSSSEDMQNIIVSGNFISKNVDSKCSYQTDPQKQHSRIGRASNASSGSCTSASSTPQTTPFHLARVALDDYLQEEAGATNYKCIKVENGDRLSDLIDRILEKHVITGDPSQYALVQLLPDGCEFRLPEKCNPYYAVAPDPSSPMLNFVLRHKCDSDKHRPSSNIAPSIKKLNRMKRSNLLRWSSGYL